MLMVLKVTQVTASMFCLCRMISAKLLQRGRQRAWNYLQDWPCKSQCRHLLSLQCRTLQMRWQLMAPVLSYLREFTSAKCLCTRIAVGCWCTLHSGHWLLDAPQVHTLNILLAFCQVCKLKRFWITNIHIFKTFIVLSCHIVYVITHFVTQC